MEFWKQYCSCRAMHSSLGSCLESRALYNWQMIFYSWRNDSVDLQAFAYRTWCKFLLFSFLNFLTCFKFFTISFICHNTSMSLSKTLIHNTTVPPFPPLCINIHHCWHLTFMNDWSRFSLCMIAYDFLYLTLSRKFLKFFISLIDVLNESWYFL